MTTKRYSTPLKYKNGLGEIRRTKVYFELDPIELMDWVIENTFEASLLSSSLAELSNIENEESRDLAPDEVRTLMYLIKILARLSAGKPTDDGEYFVKDPNWTSSYAYRAFRELLLTNEKELQAFMAAILDTETMADLTETLNKVEGNNNSETKDESETRDAEIVRLRKELRAMTDEAGN